MSTIVTRAGKGSALTHNEVDANFTNLNTDKLQSGNTANSLTITNLSGTTIIYTNANISSATIAGGSINSTTIGASTASTGAFTTLSASSTVSGTGFSTYLASPPAIGGTAAAAGSFTTLSASSTVSGTGFSTYLASPPAIGGTTAAAGSFTTLSASGVTTISAGTAAAPSLTFSGDTNTGIYSPAADTVSISTGGTERVRVNGTGTITYTRTTLASYLWSTWNPTNVTGTVTTAPSTGTTDDSDYVTMANSSGTVTVTFDIAGTYLVNLQASTFHSNVYSYDTFYFNFGGTSTRRTDRSTIDVWGDSVNDGNLFSAFPLFVTATAGQTLTVQPQYRLSGGGTTSNHNAVAAMTVQYCGG